MIRPYRNFLTKQEIYLNGSRLRNALQIVGTVNVCTKCSVTAEVQERSCIKYSPMLQQHSTFISQIRLLYLHKIIKGTIRLHMITKMTIFDNNRAVKILKKSLNIVRTYLAISYNLLDHLEHLPRRRFMCSLSVLLNKLKK